MLYILAALRWLWNPVAWRLKDLDVALGIVRRIRRGGDLPAEAGASEREATAAQLETLATFLERAHLPGRTRPDDQRNGIQEQVQLPATSLIRALAQQIMRPPGPESTGASISSMLDRLEALLEIERMIERGRLHEPASPGHRAPAAALSSATAATHAQTEPIPDAPQLQSGKRKEGTNAGELDPQEVAFLWKTSDKLYSSWPFRFLGMLMLAAVLLAGAGTYFIGGQTLQLRQNLENAARSATTDLEKIGNATREALNERSQNLTGEIDRRRGELTEKMAKAEQKIHELETGSEQLRKEAVDRVVAIITRNIAVLEARLRDDITGDLTKIKNDDVAKLQRELTALRSTVDRFASEVTKSSEDLRKSQPQLQRVVLLAGDADKLEAAAAAIRQANTSAGDAVLKADGGRQAAQTAAKEAERVRDDLAEKIKPLSPEISTHQRTLGVVQERLRNLDSEINQLQGASKRIGESLRHQDESDRRLAERSSALDKAIGSLEERAKSTGLSMDQRIADRLRHDEQAAKRLADQLAGLDKAISDLEQRAKRSGSSLENLPQTSPPTEDKLTPDQWRRIQRSLLARKFSPGKVDGKPGNKTRDAIRAFQTQLGADSTGSLTPEQIKLLIEQQTTAR